jgi:replicative superfamily II helicase
MATGTGKTLTALYCLIEECKKNKIQKSPKINHESLFIAFAPVSVYLDFKPIKYG